jgi:hypothetical protein
LHELAEHAGLGLAAQAEEEHIVLGEDGVLDLRDHGFVVADDAGEERLAALKLADQVVPHFVLDAGDGIAAGFEFSQVAWSVHESCLGVWRKTLRLP